MPNYRLSPLGKSKQISVTLDPSTIYVVKYVSKTLDISFSEALRRLVLTHSMQSPELKAVLEQQVSDAMEAEVKINGLSASTRQIVGRRLVVSETD